MSIGRQGFNNISGEYITGNGDTIMIPTIGSQSWGNANGFSSNLTPNGILDYNSYGNNALSIGGNPLINGGGNDLTKFLSIHSPGLSTDQLNQMTDDMTSKGIGIGDLSTIDNNGNYNLNTAGKHFFQGWGNKFGAVANNGTSLLDWGKFGIGAGLGVFNAYMGYKGLKLAEKQYKEQSALNRANFKNQAMAYNFNLKSTLSGRGYNGMSNAAKRQLSHSYQNNKVSTTYA